MTGIVVLDVIIGLVFIYLLYSLLATIVQEIIATMLAFRAKVLEKGILRMLENAPTGGNWLSQRLSNWGHFVLGVHPIGSDKAKLADEFYKHPLVKYLGEDKLYTKPAYLSAANFSKVMMDFLRSDAIEVGQNANTYISQTLQEGKIKFGNTVIDIPDETLRYLRSLWVDAEGEAEKYKVLLEHWFDTTMERSSGWYKQYTQVVLIIVGFVIAVTFNVDSILISSKLATDPVLREQLVQQAGAFSQAHPHLKEDLDRLQVYTKALKEQAKTKEDTLRLQQKNDSLRTLKNQIGHLDTLNTMADSLVRGDIAKMNQLLGLGWECQKCPCGKCVYVPVGKAHGLMRIVGWALTALAISLGAPFWFDLLNKLMKLRTAVKTEKKA